MASSPSARISRFQSTALAAPPTSKSPPKKIQTRPTKCKSKSVCQTGRSSWLMETTRKEGQSMWSGKTFEMCFFSLSFDSSIQHVSKLKKRFQFQTQFTSFATFISYLLIASYDPRKGLNINQKNINLLQ